MRTRPTITPKAVGSTSLGRATAPWGEWLLLTLLITATFAIRMRLASLPLERDEGEYAYLGQQLLQGIPPYLSAYTLKLPGMAVANAIIIALFGASERGIHVGFALVHAATLLGLYRLTRRLYRGPAALAATLVYAVLSISPAVLGFNAHATHFVVLPAIWGLFLILPRQEGTPAQDCSPARPGAVRVACAGMLLGVAFLMKQPGALFLGAAMLWLFMPQEPRASSGRIAILWLLLGALIPVGLTGLWLRLAGVWDRAWFWVVTYARVYASEVKFQDAGALFMKSFVPLYETAPIFWWLAAAGLLIPFRSRDALKAHGRLLALLACSAFATALTLNFRSHYFVLVLPAVAILAGVGMALLAQMMSKRIGARLANVLATAAVLMGSGLAIARERALFFELSPEAACRQLYGGNPFPECQKVARYLREHSQPGDQVLVLGSEPQIYFDSRLRSATGHIYMYGLMEDQPHALQMQEELIQQTEAARPRFVVYVTASTSWLRQTGSHADVFRWASRYLSSGHRLVGVVEVPTPEVPAAREVWGPEAMQYHSLAQNRVLVYEREAAARR